MKEACNLFATGVNKLSISSEFVSGTALAAGFVCVVSCVADG